MTSRFGKTYNRKGGEANSKFEEVFSNKKPTLTTKWGETTYKAQLGTKRSSLKSDVAELPKRPRLEVDSDNDEDPFGFDSDDESKTVTSQTATQSKSEDGHATSKPPSGQATGTKAAVASSVTSAAKQTSEEKLVKNSQSSWTRTTASNSIQKPAAASSSLTSRDRNPTGTSSLSMDATLCSKGSSQMLPGGSRNSQFTSNSSFKDGMSSEGMSQEERPLASEPPAEPVENVEPSPFTLRTANSRKYQRPGRDSASSDSADVGVAPETPCADAKPNTTVGTGVAKTAANANTAAAKAPAAGRGRGRVRDYTVLHPSCLSVCNVTIQDTIERSIDELVAPVAPADLGEAGLMKKKSDVQLVKNTRFRPVKTKKDTKLEFFGFEDKEDHGGSEGSEGGVAGGSSSYKIKYFGFDELSESDSDEEGSQVKERKKAKKAVAAAALAALSASVDSPHTSDSQDSQTSSNTGTADGLDFTEDSIPAAPDGAKVRSGKPGDKSKELTTGFKKIFSGPKKSPAKASYNARHWNQPEPEEMPPPLARAHTAPPTLSSGSKDGTAHKDDGLFKAPPPPPKVIKSETLPTRLHQDIVTALKCRKEHKELYTVVQHVKHFNDVVEFGENQEFTDDFEYLETGLKSSQPLNTRCLSIISLATRCALPGFRMHLRARGKVAHVFKMISDAPQHPNLALCTAALMYILSRDRLNMDLDRACLELMIKLLEMDQLIPLQPAPQDPQDQPDQLSPKEVAKVKEKIRKLCETVHNKHLDLENITTGHLAMETLLSLTSKRAGDWFKEELRLLGGLDHIVDKVKECVENLSEEDDKENLVASLWGAERCLRVLESVTVQNPENQGYLIAYKDSQLIVSAARGLRCCEDMIQRYSRALNNSSLCPGSELPHCSFSNVGKAVEDCMRAVIGVLLNLTHDNEWGSTKTGEQDELIVTALNCVLRAPRYIPQEQRFDVRVLGLGLLINLVEYSSRNRHILVEMDYALSEGCLDDSSLGPPAEPAPAGQGEEPAVPCQGAEPAVPCQGEEPAVPCQGEEPALLGQAEEPAAPVQGQGEEPVGKGEEPAAPVPGEPSADDEDKPPATGALAALVKLFLERERAAILAEAKTDDLISEAPKPALDQSGEWKETSGEIQWVAAETKEGAETQEPEKKKEEEEEELDLNKALQHAGKHMEDSIAASYTALLLGCLCQGSQTNATTVREHLPKGDFSIMTEMLKKFLNFMNLTCSVGTTGQKSITRVIEYLERC
ncbi:wings apart-like protein homolog isoform X3 [Gadus morhua]|uniref:wings apart-like protein homolog isoform X3 n=1 Tax=Gadus morhua TaxID=8049 RepID=UPI0011B38946|nr:wings apart-like protein homolog isoform X3 [Gadus morhua]